jgi:hypothetical protein
LTDQSSWELSYQVSAGTLTLANPVSVKVVVTGRKYLDAHVYFPKAAAGAGQTTRTFGGGSPNNFFAADSTTRLQARSDFMTAFGDQSARYSQYAGIDLYWTIDPDSPQIAGFDSNGSFGWGDANGDISSHIQNLMLNGEPNTSLKIYFVHDLIRIGGAAPDLSGITHGWNIPAFYDSTRLIWAGRIIMLADDAGPDTLAHEVLHAAGLDHVVAWSDMSGKLNNLKNVMANSSILSQDPAVANNPLNWNLLRPGRWRRRAPDFATLTDKQGAGSYSNMDSHPFFRLTD